MPVIPKYYYEQQIINHVFLSCRGVSVDEKAKVTLQRKLLVKEQRESYALRMEKLYKLSLASHVGLIWSSLV